MQQRANTVDLSSRVALGIAMLLVLFAVLALMGSRPLSKSVL